MGDALGLHPLAIILAIIIGAKTQGVFGIIFALPILAMCNAVIDYFAELNRLKVRVSR
jgi:predicted PurR-regulated permease PerM